MIIENDAQYQGAKQQLASLARLLAWLAVMMTNSPAQRIMLRPADEALGHLASELGIAVQEYEQLMQMGTPVVVIGSLLDLGHALARARVAAHLSLMAVGTAARQSAEAAANFEAGIDTNLRLEQVEAHVRALGVRVRIEITLPSPPVTSSDQQALQGGSDADAADKDQG